jgi:ATP-dependent 26S proteasome regulatory subunit
MYVVLLQARMEILKIHASKLAKSGDIDYEAVVKLAEGFNGADLRNICTGGGGAGGAGGGWGALVRQGRW